MNHINNWITQLSAPLVIGATALPVSGEALTRLGLGEGVTYTLVVVSRLDAMQQGDAEILHIIGSTGGGHTLLRAREGTTERDWGTGAYVYSTVTAGTLDAVQGELSGALQQVAAMAERIGALDAVVAAVAERIGTLDAVVAAMAERIGALDRRVAVLETGGGELPSNALVDSAGNPLVNGQGDYLVYGVTPESGGGELPNNTLVDSAGNALVNSQSDYLVYGA